MRDECHNRLFCWRSFFFLWSVDAFYMFAKYSKTSPYKSYSPSTLAFMRAVNRIFLTLQLLLACANVFILFAEADVSRHTETHILNGFNAKVENGFCMLRGQRFVVWWSEQHMNTRASAHRNGQRTATKYLIFIENAFGRIWNASNDDVCTDDEFIDEIDVEGIY